MGILKRLFGRERASTFRDDGREMVSLVALSRSRAELSCDLLLAHLDVLYPGHFLPADQPGSFVVSGPDEDTQFLIKSDVPEREGIFQLHNVPRPYTEVSGFARYIEDQSLRHLATTQDCWLSIDLIHRVTTDENSYRFIGQALARVAPADAAVLVHPSRMAAIPFNDDIRRQLARGDRVV